MLGMSPLFLSIDIYHCFQILECQLTLRNLIFIPQIGFSPSDSYTPIA